MCLKYINVIVNFLSFCEEQGVKFSPFFLKNKKILAEGDALKKKKSILVFLASCMKLSVIFTINLLKRNLIHHQYLILCANY